MAQLGEHSRSNGHARAAMRARAGDVMDDFSALRKDMRRLARAANKAARVEVRHAGERISNAGASLRSQARHGVDMVSDHIRERPAATMGLALGAGLILGMLFSPRR